MGYVKTYRLSKNKINPAEVDLISNTSLGPGPTLSWTYSATASGRTIRIPVKPSTQYIIKPYGDATSSTIWRIATTNSELYPTASATSIDVSTIAVPTEAPANGTYMWTGSSVKYIVMQINSSLYTDINDLKTMIGLYEVSGEGEQTPATCEAYGVTDWYDWAKRKTATSWTDATTAKAPFGENEAKGENSKLMKMVKSDPNE